MSVAGQIRLLGRTLLHLSQVYPILVLAVAVAGALAVRARGRSRELWVLTFPLVTFYPLIVTKPRVARLRFMLPAAIPLLVLVTYWTAWIDRRLGPRYGKARIASHKRRFLLPTAERFRLFWLLNMARPWQSVLEAVLTLLGLCGLALLFRKRCAFAWVAMLTLVTYPAVYYLIQASPRYRFPVEPILFLLAASLLSGYMDGTKVRIAPANRPPHSHEVP